MYERHAFNSLGESQLGSIFFDVMDLLYPEFYLLESSITFDSVMDCRIY